MLVASSDVLNSSFLKTVRCELVLKSELVFKTVHQFGKTDNRLQSRRALPAHRDALQSRSVQCRILARTISASIGLLDAVTAW